MTTETSPTIVVGKTRVRVLQNGKTGVVHNQNTDGTYDVWYDGDTGRQAVDLSLDEFEVVNDYVGLTRKEAEIVVALGKVWNLFQDIGPTGAPNEAIEFMQHVHHAQHMILARPGRRQLLVMQKSGDLE